MEIPKSKYNNLQKFLMTIDDANEWIQWIQTVPFEQFYLTIKAKAQLSTDQIMSDIIQTSKIDDAKLNDDIKTKLLRYIEYFKQVSAII